MEINRSNDPDIVLGQLEDLQKIMYLFDAVKVDLHNKGINQWPYHYPSSIWFEMAIQNQEVFLTKEGDRISGVFALNLDQDEDYEAIKWQFDGERIFVLHRLAVHPDFQEKGIGKKLVEASIDLAKLNGGSSMRLDVFSANPIAVNLYRKVGFQQAEGHCFFHENKDPFYCFEIDFEK